MTPFQSVASFLNPRGRIGRGEGAWADRCRQPSASPPGRRPKRPRVAALASTYFYLSHAYHIVGRFLDGFPVYAHDGRRRHLHRPAFEIASLFIEQAADATDLGRAKAARHGVRLSPTIADALTLGTGKLAVDAVLLIAEHGDYPLNDKLQKLYPRGRYFREVARRLPGLGPERPGLHRQAPLVQPRRGPADGRPGRGP